jgi:hypothetical protein
VSDPRTPNIVSFDIDHPDILATLQMYFSDRFVIMPVLDAITVGQVIYGMKNTLKEAGETIASATGAVSSLLGRDASDTPLENSIILAGANQRQLGWRAGYETGFAEGLGEGVSTGFNKHQPGVMLQVEDGFWAGKPDGRLKDLITPKAPVRKGRPLWVRLAYAALATALIGALVLPHLGLPFTL